MSIKLKHRRWLNVKAASKRQKPLWNWRAALGLLLPPVALVLIMLALVRSATLPLKRLAYNGQRR